MCERCSILKNTSSWTSGGTGPVDSLVKPVHLLEELKRQIVACRNQATYAYAYTSEDIKRLLEKAVEEIKKLEDDRQWQIKQNAKMFEALEEISKADGTPENPKHISRSALIQVAINGMVEAV